MRMTVCKLPDVNLVLLVSVLIGHQKSERFWAIVLDGPTCFIKSELPVSVIHILVDVHNIDTIEELGEGRCSR